MSAGEENDDGAARAPRLLITGFGPFPGAPENPSERLVRTLAKSPARSFGAAALRAAVLATDYRRSWPALRRLYSRIAPDVVVHFGLSRNAEAIVLERRGRRAVDVTLPDAAGFAPKRGFARRAGPDELASSLPIDAILGELQSAGFPAATSDDAGGYVCNATLYRSLGAAPAGRLAGFVHIPPEGAGGLNRERLADAAALILRTAASAWTARRAGAG